MKALVDQFFQIYALKNDIVENSKNKSFANIDLNLVQ